MWWQKIFVWQKICHKKNGAKTKMLMAQNRLWSPQCYYLSERGQALSIFFTCVLHQLSDFSALRFSKMSIASVGWKCFSDFSLMASIFSLSSSVPLVPPDFSWYTFSRNFENTYYEHFFSVNKNIYYCIVLCSLRLSQAKRVGFWIEIVKNNSNKEKTEKILSVETHNCLICKYCYAIVSVYRIGIPYSTEIFRVFWFMFENKTNFEKLFVCLFVHSNEL